MLIHIQKKSSFSKIKRRGFLKSFVITFEPQFNIYSKTNPNWGKHDMKRENKQKKKKNNEESKWNLLGPTLNFFGGVFRFASTVIDKFMK